MQARHIAYAALAGWVVGKVVDANPEWITDAKGQPLNKNITPVSVGIGAGALVAYALHSGRFDNMQQYFGSTMSAGEINIGSPPMSTFHSNTISSLVV
jgi:hypothetical protein